MLHSGRSRIIVPSTQCLLGWEECGVARGGERVATTRRCGVGCWQGGVMLQAGQRLDQKRQVGIFEAIRPGMSHAACQHLEAGICQGGASGWLDSGKTNNKVSSVKTAIAFSEQERNSSLKLTFGLVAALPRYARVPARLRLTGLADKAEHLQYYGKWATEKRN